jgi:Concanavalin A-like lectin/glucanases superfamily
MYLTKDKLQHINTIAHEGKVVVVATDADGKISYSVKQDGFEDSYLNTPPELRTGWEKWQELEFPNEVDDQSVIDRETEELTDSANPSSFVLRSRYQTKDETAVAPVQLVSSSGHIYVFRQSKTNTLLVDRFVLDGMTNKLNRKLEVRFKRSRQKHEASQNMKKGASGLTNIDSLDFRDVNGNFFYEPTTEICTINNLYKGWFSVVLVPTMENNVYRWHIFAYNNQTKKVELTTMRVSDEGLFDVQDYTVFVPSNDSLIPRNIPGIIKRSLDLGSVTVVNGLSATKYDIQREKQTDEGMQLLRDSTKVMLAIPTSNGNVAAFSFAITTDGLLAQISSTPSSKIWRSTVRQMLLPLNTLDNIKAIGTTAPPPQGQITALQRGDDDGINVISSTATNLDATKINQVKISGTQDYNSFQQSITTIDKDTFEITAPSTVLGNWEVIPEQETGLVFNGMITAYEITDTGKIRVTASNHGLNTGEGLQIVDTRNYNGTFTVQKIDDQTFTLDDVKWQAGTAVNLKLESQKRRGLVLDGVDDYVQLPPESMPIGNELTVTFWAKGGNSLPSNNSLIYANGANNERVLNIQLPYSDGTIYFDCGADVNGYDRITKLAQSTESKGQWVHWAFTKNAKTGEMKVYRNGILWHSGTGLKKPLPKTAILHFGKIATANSNYYDGTVSELCIWKSSRTEEQIRNSMYLQLTGKETGLVGYWRLGAVVEEDKERKIIDFSVNGNDGVVYGGAYVSAVTLPRNLAGTTNPAVKYENEELFAVSENATYEEEFEFKVTPVIDPNNVDGLSGKIFQIIYKGKTSRGAIDWVNITPNATEFTNLGGGWYKAKCRFNVPDGVSLVRSFGIGNIKGTWTTLEVRKQLISLLSDSITEAQYTDRVTLATLADNQAQLAVTLKQIELKEQQEGTRLKEKRDLEAKIAAYLAQAETRKKIDQLTPKIQTLTTEEQTLSAKYNAELNSPFNYECHIVNQMYLNHRLAPCGFKDNRYYMVLRPIGDEDYYHKWKFVSLGENNYQIVNLSYPNHRLAPCGFSGNRYNMVLRPIGDEDYYHNWKFISLGGNNYQVVNQMYLNHRLAPCGFSDNRYNMVLRPIGDEDYYHNWKFVSLGTQSNNNIPVAYQDWQKKLQELNQAKDELKVLNAALVATAADKAAWEARIVQIIQELGTIQTELSTLNTSFINGVKTTQQTPQTMPQIAKDSNGLVTQGAFLGFVSSTSRLNAIETCEGNVQLSYFDSQGRMRLTNYDATSDSSNTAFEQWLPDAQRTCLNFSNGNSVVKLNQQLYLSTDWSIEAWFCYPLPETTQWNTLIRGQNGDSHIIVTRDQKLGIYLTNDQQKPCFYDSGFSMQSLSSGWHHLTAVGEGNTTRFYIDGKQVGDTKAKAVGDADAILNLVKSQIDRNPYGVMKFDGVNDHIKITAKLPTDNEITIEYWFKGNYLQSAVRQQEGGNFIIAGWNGLHTISSDGGTGAGIKVGDTATNGSWHHIAMTWKRNTPNGFVSYLDGVLVAQRNSLDVALPTFSTSAPVCLGSFGGTSEFTNGQLTEVRIWNKARTQAEIQADMGKRLTGKELSLVAYYPLNAIQLEGTTQKVLDFVAGNNGTVFEATNVTDQTLSLTEANASLKVKLEELKKANFKVTNDISAIGNNHLAPNKPVDYGVMKFDGVNDYIDGATGILADSYTKEVWIKLESGNPQNNIISGYGSHAFWAPNGLLSAGHNNSWSYVQDPTPLAANTWIHVAVTYDSSTQTMKLYKNGQLIKSATSVPIVSTTDRNITIGAFGNPRGSFFKGSMADVRIWNKARTQAEIQADMGKRLTGKELNLVAYYPLNAIDVTTKKVLDLVAGNNGTVFEAINVTDQTLSLSAGIQGEQFGKVAEVRIWELALTKEEIEVNSKTLITGNESGLLAYYPMNEATGTDVRDNSGKGNNATVSGANWWGCTSAIGYIENSGIPVTGGTVMKFDGINDSIQTTFKIPTGDAITIEYWFKGSSLQSAVRQQDVNGFIVAGWNNSGTLLHIISTDGSTAGISVGAAATNGSWHHVAMTWKRNTTNGFVSYLDGVLVAQRNSANVGLPAMTISPVYLGTYNNTGEYTNGQMAEVRIWNKARTQAEIQADMNKRLTGKEANLLAYYPLNEIKVESGVNKVVDLVANNNGTIKEAIAVEDKTFPIKSIADNALISSEYSTIIIDPTTQGKSAIMRRFFAYPVENGLNLLLDKRIEILELKWVGNAQFAPTLLGYIEGPPPVPSENLTLADDYNGATSVELVMSEDVEFNWTRTQDSGLGATVDAFVGGGGAMSLVALAGLPGAEAGTSIETSAKFGFKGDFETSYQFQNESSITASSSLSMTDKLELRGTPEADPKFPHLGSRFIPKNIGYALVISSIADVFITRLARSRKMVSYQVQPVDGIPPDVNTITFLINPAYTMNGSLDGMTGSSATSDRFFKHVPEMRAQYGSLYPASYYRLQEAYDLKRQIEAEDKRRESYFFNFNVRTIDETSLGRNIESGDQSGYIGVQREEDKPMTASEKSAAQDAKVEQFQADIDAISAKTSDAADEKMAQIKSKIADQEKQVHATESFAGWQTKMENIQTRAGKRNIVNTYVWDADGGLRTEAQSFANTVEHTIGGSFSMNAGLGGLGEFVMGADIELTAQATVNMTQTMSKTETRSKGLELNIDLSGMENKGVTDYKDNPLMPGEKVDRYRFMSFYLEGNYQNFHDFFNYVVDPEWLQSNDEEARALRQVQTGKPNPAWRVLHRVTYIERPALMGFGRDIRQLKTQDENVGIGKVIVQVDTLQQKVDQILEWINSQK